MTFTRSVMFAARAVLSFSILALGQAPAPKVFTEKDREFGLKYANDTRGDFIKQLTGISDSQLNFRADVSVILTITNRQQKFTAPEQVRPNGRWKIVPDLLTNFETTRKTSVDYMKNMKEDMRSHFASMPFGKIDAFQSYLFMIGHSERHLAQLKEVKADANYPTK